MRPLPWTDLERYRVRTPPMDSPPGEAYGGFLIPYRGVVLSCIVTDGRDDSLGPEYAWEHVSVSMRNRVPNWQEMSFVKNLFWRDDETVMQLHVPGAEHINIHANCLHLWRPLNLTIPLPPRAMV